MRRRGEPWEEETEGDRVGGRREEDTAGYQEWREQGRGAEGNDADGQWHDEGRYRQTGQGRRHSAWRRPPPTTAEGHEGAEEAMADRLDRPAVGAGVEALERCDTALAPDAPTAAQHLMTLTTAQPSRGLVVGDWQAAVGGAEGASAVAATSAACAGCVEARDFTRRDQQGVVGGLQPKPAHQHCHMCGAVGRVGPVVVGEGQCGACGQQDTGAVATAAAATGVAACNAGSQPVASPVCVSSVRCEGAGAVGTGECEWAQVQQALRIAAAERGLPDGDMRLPTFQCGMPTTSCRVQGGGGRWYELRPAVWEWLESRLWFAVQRRRARTALATRAAELEHAASWFDAVRERGLLEVAMVPQAVEAAAALRATRDAYVQYTARALEATRRRLRSQTDSVTHRPLMHWWSLAAWLHDYTVLGIGSALRRWPEAAVHDNYRTAVEPGTEKEYARLWRLGYWRKGPVRVRAPLGARLKPNGKWRTVYDATAGGLNDHIHRSGFPLPSFDDFAANFYPSCFLGKADFSDWFYHLPAAEYTKQLLGITDPHTGVPGRYEVYAMGLAESPHYGNLYGGELLRQVAQRAPFIGTRVYNPAHGSGNGAADRADGLMLPTTFRLAPDGGLASEAQLYCDDVGLSSRSWGQSAQAAVQYAHVTRDMGVVMSYPKSEGPSQRLPMLGLGVDVSKDEEGIDVFITKKKRDALLQLLREHRHGAWERGFDTRRNLCAIVSKLYFVVPACPAAADQCRELWDVCFAGVDINGPRDSLDYERKMRLTGGWKAAAWWWERLLADTTFTGTTRRKTGRHRRLYGWSDASGSLAKAGAWGATVHFRDDAGTEHQGQAHADFTGVDIDKHSTYKELRGIEEQLKILDSSDVWRARARGACLVAHTDCQPVACAVAKRRAHAKALRPLIRRIRGLCARLDVQLEAKWCQGTRLIAQGCDSVSRDHKLGVFADDAPDADSFLPTACLARQWTPELGRTVQEWSGCDLVSFDPAAWDDVAVLRERVVLAPRATDTRRCLTMALDLVRNYEFELGLTVVVVDSVPCDWRGLKKYFKRQRHIAPGEGGLSKDEAVGVWLLQLEPPATPALGGMPRQTIEERVYARFAHDLPIDDSALLDRLTDDAIHADALALAASTCPLPRCYDGADDGEVHGVR